MTAFYNEIDGACVAVLKEQIAHNVIAPGIVESRSIKDINPDDIKHYIQAHFFAGGGLWSVAARLAGWPDDRPLWSASCPCQPFSQAGKGAGTADERHLWPDLFRLVRAVRPRVLVGEQVSGAAGYGWLDGVRADLASEGYTCWAYDIPACALDAPHIRNRLYWVATRHMANPDRCGEIENRRDAAEVGRFSETQRRAEHGPALLRREPSTVVADVADASDAAERRRELQRSGESASPHRIGSSSELAGPYGGELVNAPSLGWSEGRTEPELRSGRDAAAVADAPGDVGYSGSKRRAQAFGSSGDRASAHSQGAADCTERTRFLDRAHEPSDVADADGSGFVEGQRNYSAARYGDSVGAAYGGNGGSFWSDAEWIACHDGKARRTKSGLRDVADGVSGSLGGCDDLGAITPEEKEAVTKVLGPALLVDALPGRVDLWRIAGNAIVPALAAEVLKALMETLDTSSIRPIVS